MIEVKAGKCFAVMMALVLIASLGFAVLPAGPAGAATTPMVAAGFFHTVGLTELGTVVAAGRNDEGQCNVSSWKGITQVAAGSYHTVGLKSDGTVVAVGNKGYGQCDVSSWKGITQVAAGSDHTVGLKSDGTVVAVGQTAYGACDVSSWKGIIQMAAVGDNTRGLKSDGTVVAVGFDDDTFSWPGVIQICGGVSHAVGLKSNGTVVTKGSDHFGECNVSSWTGITQVAAGSYHTVGLKSDGTVVAVGLNNEGQCKVSSWTGITQVAAFADHTVGLKSDGTVVAVGYNSYGQCNVSKWKLAIPVATVIPGALPQPSPPSQPQSSTYTVILDVSPTQAQPGEPVRVAVTVVNNSTSSTSHNVVLKINGSVEGEHMVELPVGAARVAEFMVTKSQPGTYSVSIDGQQASFTVLGDGTTPGASPSPQPPAGIRLQNLSVSPVQAQPGQTVTILVDVVNDSTSSTSYNANLMINSSIEGQQTVQLPPETALKVEFLVSKSEPGTYTVAIDGQQGSFTVLGDGTTPGQPAGTPGVGADTKPRAPFSINMLDIILICALVVVSAVALVLGLRRKKA